MKYTPVQIEKMLASMKVYVDTREHQTAEFRRRIQGLECPCIRKALRYGDYSCCFTDTDGREISLERAVVVERKMSLAEICANFTQGRGRFIREFERSSADGCKVHILIENESYEKLYAGAYRSRMTPEALAASLCTFFARYGCALHFCRSSTTSRLIRDLLHYHLREYLLQSERERGDAR